MDQHVSQQIDQKLREQWDALYPQILDRFTTVSKADIESAHTADDLVRRISDRTQFSERYVETTLNELVSVGGGQSAQQKPFVASSQHRGGQGSQSSQSGQRSQGSQNYGQPNS